MTSVNLFDKYEEIIKELEEIQGKTVTNADYWTVQMCIEVIKKHQRKEKTEEE